MSHCNIQHGEISSHLLDISRRKRLLINKGVYNHVSGVQVVVPLTWLFQQFNLCVSWSCKLLGATAQPSWWNLINQPILVKELYTYIRLNRIFSCQCQPLHCLISLLNQLLWFRKFVFLFLTFKFSLSRVSVVLNTTKVFMALDENRFVCLLFD